MSFSKEQLAEMQKENREKYGLGELERDSGTIEDHKLNDLLDNSGFTNDGLRRGDQGRIWETVPAWEEEIERERPEDSGDTMGFSGDSSQNKTKEVFQIGILVFISAMALGSLLTIFVINLLT